MKVIVELEPRDMWALAARAEAAGKRLPDYIRGLMVEPPDTVAARMASMWSEGKCDADIATALGLTLRVVAEKRRGLGLPANQRYRKTPPKTPKRKGHAA